MRAHIPSMTSHRPSMTSSDSDSSDVMPADVTATRTRIRSTHKRQNSLPTGALVNYNSKLRRTLTSRGMVHCEHDVITHWNSQPAESEHSADDVAPDVIHGGFSAPHEHVDSPHTASAHVDSPHTASAHVESQSSASSNAFENQPRLNHSHIYEYSKFISETVAGVKLSWLPFKWLQEPEKFIAERRGTKSANRIHKHADSLFSTTSGFSDFRGFFNLAVLLLVLSSARVALENIIKYGILVDPTQFLPLFLKDPYSVPSLSIVIVSNVFVVFAFMVEKLLATRSISERSGCALHIMNLCWQLGFPCYVILTRHPNPVFSSVALLINTMVFLKLISYKQTLKWCRVDYIHRTKQLTMSRDRHKSISVAKESMESHFADEKSENNIPQYPDNVTMKDLYYFLLAPTLCYELAFPRSGRIRKRFLLKRLAEVAFISGLILALIQQWVLPLVHNALVPFNQMYLPTMLERILKLALPNFCIWLLWFYSTFHSLLNVLAELLMFADRVFYHDWWNSETVSEFWQKWNIPVHRWASRHLYKPMLTGGYSKTQAMLAVFFCSALFHELLVSIPLGIFRLYAFMGMVLQVPLAILTAKLHPVSPKMCNVIVWGSLIIGQPIAVLMYYVDYYITTQTQLGVQSEAV